LCFHKMSILVVCAHHIVLWRLFNKGTGRLSVPGISVNRK
jgi:hypothetical protein